MRRFLAIIAIPLLSCLVIAGCGSSKPAPPADPNSSVTATGSFGKAPKVTIPTLDAGKSLAVKNLITGTGPVLAASDSFVGNYVAYIWSGTGHKLAANTYTSTPQLFAGALLPGLEKALIGKPVGSRVLAVLPPADGYGSSGNPQAGVSGTDTLVFVIDVVKKYPAGASASGATVSRGGGSLPTVGAASGTAPTVKVPPGQPPKTLVTKTLIKGTGPVLTSGQYAVVQYTGVIWRTGKVFDSSWSRSAPFGFVVNQAGMITGWSMGLAGQTVGSRVMLVIPPKDGYGSTGEAQAGIKGTDTLVFIVDILGGYSPQ